MLKKVFSEWWDITLTMCVRRWSNFLDLFCYSRMVRQEAVPEEKEGEISGEGGRWKDGGEIDEEGGWWWKYPDHHRWIMLVADKRVLWDGDLGSVYPPMMQSVRRLSISKIADHDHHDHHDHHDEQDEHHDHDDHGKKWVGSQFRKLGIFQYLLLLLCRHDQMYEFIISQTQINKIVFILLILLGRCCSKSEQFKSI